MDTVDRDYFLGKAEAEIDLANAATLDRTALTHFQLAAFYLDRAQDGAANDDQR
ncbi:MAG: hypothetical protein ACXWUN_12100 [Allosphingosinicella sp.]